MLDINASSGTKVIFLCHGGYECEQNSALMELKLYGIYTVSYTVVHDCYTDVHLREVPNRSFNSALFEEAGIVRETYKKLIETMDKTKYGKEKT